MRGAKDSEIVEYAFKNELLIITSDKDFGELTFRLQMLNSGIILLRLPDADCMDKATVLLSALKKLHSNAKNKFIVIDRLKIRIRNML